jgi:hypothetical protein
MTRKSCRKYSGKSEKRKTYLPDQETGKKVSDSD